MNETQIPQRIKVDDPTVDAIAASYPEKVREPLQWLAAYYRESCNKNQDVLLERIKKCGFKRSRHYLYTIFTGRYFRKVDGDDDPVGQIENFLQIVEKLRGNFVISQRAGKIPFVETTTYRRIANYIDVIRMPDTVCKFGVIIGPTGSQKSASFDHYVELNNHGKCVRVEAPASPSIGKFIDDLAGRYGAALRERKNRKLEIITESVRADRTIIIDNAQRLRRPERGHDQPIFHFLQKLQDDTGCAIILSFTPDEARFLTEALAEDKLYFEQFEGRAGGRESFLELDNYTPRADLLQIAQAFGLENPQGAVDELDKLCRRAGRVRILFHVLQAAKRRADKAMEKLTLDHLLMVSPELKKMDALSPGGAR